MPHKTDNLRVLWNRHKHKLLLFYLPLITILLVALYVFVPWNRMANQWNHFVKKETKKDTTITAPIDSIAFSQKGKEWIAEIKRWKKKFFDETDSHKKDAVFWKAKFDSLKNVGCGTKVIIIKSAAITKKHRAKHAKKVVRTGKKTYHVCHCHLKRRKVYHPD